MLPLASTDDDDSDNDILRPCVCVFFNVRVEETNLDMVIS